MSRRLSVAIIVAGSLLALFTIQPGLDYFNDSGSIDALVRGDLPGFFAEQPLMGPLSVLLRAPFVALVFHGDLTTVYVVGLLPCLAVLVALAVWVWWTMGRAGRSLQDRSLVALLLVGSIVLVRSVHWGHPEDVLGAALMVAALFAAGRDRALWAGVLLGLAAASKQWAVLAGLPILLVLPSRRIVFVAAAAAATALFYVPMLVGDPDAFFRVMRAAGSTAPLAELGFRSAPPATHVNPFCVWLPFAHWMPYQGHSMLFMSDSVGRFTHPLIAVAALVLPALVWRRRRRLELVDGFKLVALVLLARCALDPMSVEYYHLPMLLALAGAAAVGGRRELDAALLACAGLTVAFIRTASGPLEFQAGASLKFAAYMATVLPLGFWLARDLGLLPSRRTRARSVTRVRPA